MTRQSTPKSYEDDDYDDDDFVFGMGVQDGENGKVRV